MENEVGNPGVPVLRFDEAGLLAPLHQSGELTLEHDDATMAVLAIGEADLARRTIDPRRAEAYDLAEPPAG